jgi:hypothetical protein
VTPEDEEFIAGFYRESFAGFEKLGEASVLLLLAENSLPTQEREMALVWLGRQAQESKQRSEAFNAEVSRTAHRANVIAIASAIITIISVIWTVISHIFHL